MANARVRRGRATQELVAAWFRGNGWPGAESRAASLPGEDILGLGPNVSVEVKASSRFDIRGAVRQADANAYGKVPLVVWRGDGQGLACIEQWLVVTTLGNMTDLLRAAQLHTDLEHLGLPPWAEEGA